MIMGQATFKAIVNKGGDNTSKVGDTQAANPLKNNRSR
jgi:hypothetical protein